MLFADVCAGFIRCCYGACGERRCLEILGAPGVPCAYGGVLALLVYPFMPTGSATQARLSQDTPSGPRSVGHYLRSFLGVHWFPVECAGTIGKRCNRYVCHVFG